MVACYLKREIEEFVDSTFDLIHFVYLMLESDSKTSILKAKER